MSCSARTVSFCEPLYATSSPSASHVQLSFPQLTLLFIMTPFNQIEDTALAFWLQQYFYNYNTQDCNIGKHAAHLHPVKLTQNFVDYVSVLTVD